MRKKLKHISLLALLAVAAQEACAEDFNLGRPLYRDGDWNTLCLPFSMTETQIDNSPLAGTVIKELDGNESNLTNGVLTLNFNEATADNEGNIVKAGMPYIVKWPADFTINNYSDWETFVINVSEGETSAGKIVRLAANISIRTGDMVGNYTNNFKGTFDGGGHTITCDIEDASDQGAAPFFCIQGATIMNLKVTGSVTGGNHSAGLVGFAMEGTNTIKNCWVDVYVTCRGNHCGGILGHGHSSTTTISDCLYSGTITGNGSTTVGVIYGWTNQSGGTHTIVNCLANGTYASCGTIDMMQRDGTDVSLTATNCYQNIASEGKMGTYIGSYSASQLVSNLGNSNWQEIGNKAVPKMNAVIAGKTDPISDPVFSGVTDYCTTPIDVPFTGGTFKGTFDELTINDNNRNSILLFAARNKLGYANTDRTLSAYSAYFDIPVVNGSQTVRSFVVDFGDGGETGIDELEADSSLFTHHSSLSGWYMLDGRRLDRQPTKAGLYINKGRKVIIK